ncbi:hypothetical protein ILUMI_11242 [Ignelater luminosus]|uniref:Integrase catalytic domain-containing protein n=1 Tax=Ignelater luminosus TaxID=2038154 RepID=A0A8K0CYU0_IGNLU|nr:hypothetical protein ILUMI_11242 [Ignelater luminosus]
MYTKPGGSCNVPQNSLQPTSVLYTWTVQRSGKENPKWTADGKPKRSEPAAATDASILLVEAEAFSFEGDSATWWDHQNRHHVRAMLQREMGINVPLEKDLCEPCVYGKAHKLPFGHRKSASKPGELVSADVCEPFSESFGKKRYVAIFKDNFTKYRQCYLLKEKSEVRLVLRDFRQYVKIVGHTVKEFLSDNGSELDNKDIRDMLQAEGITQRLTVPYTPEQNGDSEREFRTCIEMARTFKYSSSEAGFPKALWAELVATATYILNRTGKLSKEGASPYELLCSYSSPEMPNNG